MTKPHVQVRECEEERCDSDTNVERNRRRRLGVARAAAARMAKVARLTLAAEQSAVAFRARAVAATQAALSLRAARRAQWKCKKQRNRGAKQAAQTSQTELTKTASGDPHLID